MAEGRCTRTQQAGANPDLDSGLGVVDRCDPRPVPDVILSAGRDGLDAEEAILDAAKDAGVKLSKEQRNRVYDLTLGEFIHRLAEGVAPCRHLRGRKCAPARGA